MQAVGLRGRCPEEEVCEGWRGRCIGAKDKTGSEGGGRVKREGNGACGRVVWAALRGVIGGCVPVAGAYPFLGMSVGASVQSHPPKNQRQQHEPIETKCCQKQHECATRGTFARWACGTFGRWACGFEQGGKK
jgi:hypothetical protein